MKSYTILFTGILALALGACSTDYETVPVEQFTQEFVFSETDSIGEKAKEFLNNIYSSMQNGHNRVGGDYLDAATDDAISSSLTQNDVFNLAMGNYNSMNRIASDMEWGEYYRTFREVNTFVNNIDRVPLIMTYNGGQKMNKAWKAEARFLRAYHYFNLLKRYGGVPIVPETPFILGDNVELPRSTFSECVEYIVDELDEIKDSLRTRPVDNPQSDAHVVTKGAALALKSRVLLYAASPLFNGGNIDAQNELTGYTDYSQQRWARAADAAMEFIDELPYYQLSPNFGNVFIEEGNPEVIFFRQGGRGRGVELTNAPIGYSAPNDADGRTSPTQNLVDAFPMLDGKPITDNTSIYTYSFQDQYRNRDPRLKLTVLHNNSLWLNADVETFLGGKDNPNAAIQKTKTSYYMRKFMGFFENVDDYTDVRHDWVIFRYAEILLNYAEALNEASGPTDAVYDAIKQLRARAGIDPGADSMYGLETGISADEMREIIQNERRIEMAFEEHRYWDLRRWKLASEVYNNPLNGLLITRSAGTLNYNLQEVLQPSFQENRYFYPIPYSEVVKNSNMIQNPGW